MENRIKYLAIITVFISVSGYSQRYFKNGVELGVDSNLWMNGRIYNYSLDSNYLFYLNENQPIMKVYYDQFLYDLDGPGNLVEPSQEITRYGDTIVNSIYQRRSHQAIVPPLYSESNIVAKKGGIMLRHDNWLGANGGYAEYQWENVNALENYLKLAERHGLRCVLGLNEQWETYWVNPDRFDGDSRRYALWWRDIQSRGHEIATHGASHSNYNYKADTNYLLYVKESTPGVKNIDTLGPTYVVYLDTINYGDGLRLSEAGFDLYLKRSQRMMEFIGLNAATYWIEGGGQSVTYPEDSLAKPSYLNRIIGGGKYTNQKYKHMGFNPPLEWIGKSEFFMDWLSAEAITPTTDSHIIDETRNLSNPAASDIIKKTVDGSAKNQLIIYRMHATNQPTHNPPDQWVIDMMDSVYYFIGTHRHYIANHTGTEWTRIMYQGKTNPYLNCLPANPITGQCFEDNIDSVYSDTMPDGWDIGTEAAYWEIGGSQGSKGYVSIGTTKGDNLQLTRHYGLEKGTNQFTIDIKDSGANDTVYIEFSYYYGDDYLTLSHTEIQLAFPSTAAWVTNIGEVTLPHNTSYMNMNVWTRTADSFIDELTLRKKY